MKNLLIVVVIVVVAFTITVLVISYGTGKGKLKNGGFTGFHITTIGEQGKEYIVPNFIMEDPFVKTRVVEIEQIRQMYLTDSQRKQDLKNKSL